LAASAWGMVYIVFTSISVNSSRIISRPDLLLMMLIVLLLFYGIIYLVSVKIGRRYLNTKDSIALIFGSVLRNLAIGIGLAATAFGPDAALLITLAFIIQPPAASLFMRINKKYGLLSSNNHDD
jgi:predicted Na+-dependent transporter